MSKDLSFVGSEASGQQGEKLKAGKQGNWEGKEVVEVHAGRGGKECFRAVFSGAGSTPDRS